MTDQQILILKYKGVLQKLNQKNVEGKELYQEVYFSDKTNNHEKVYGSVGTLEELAKLQQPSVRKQTRHLKNLQIKIKHAQNNQTI